MGGAGPGWYLRLDTRRQALWTTLRGGEPDPLRWPEWTNQAWHHQLGTGRTLLTDLGPGLVFRLALARHHTAFTRVHPDGDELILLGADGTVRRSPCPVWTVLPVAAALLGRASNAARWPPHRAPTGSPSPGAATARCTSSTRRPATRRRVCG